MKLALKLKKIREARANGESLVPPTIAEENLENVENRVNEEFAKNKVFFNQQVVTTLDNIAAGNDPVQSNKEKMRGKFSLKIGQELPVAKKIEKYGQDSMVFHLHKNRNFLRKIER